MVKSLIINVIEHMPQNRVSDTITHVTLSTINGVVITLPTCIPNSNLYDDDVVLLSRSSASLQRLLNKLYDFCTSSSLEVILAKTKIMIFGHNKRKLNQEAFYLDKDQIEMTHEYKYLGIDFHSHG